MAIPPCREVVPVWSTITPSVSFTTFPWSQNKISNLHGSAMDINQGNWYWNFYSECLSVPLKIWSKEIKNSMVFYLWHIIPHPPSHHMQKVVSKCESLTLWTWNRTVCKKSQEKKTNFLFKPRSQTYFTKEEYKLFSFIQLHRRLGQQNTVQCDVHPKGQPHQSQTKMTMVVDLV